MTMDQVLADIRRVLADPSPRQRSGPLRDGESVHVPMMIFDNDGTNAATVQDGAAAWDGPIAAFNRSQGL